MSSPKYMPTIDYPTIVSQQAQTVMLSAEENKRIAGNMATQIVNGLTPDEIYVYNQFYQDFESEARRTLKRNTDVKIFTDYINKRITK